MKESGSKLFRLNDAAEHFGVSRGNKKAAAIRYGGAF